MLSHDFGVAFMPWILTSSKFYFMLILNFFMTEVLLYRNRSIDLKCKSMDWFLYIRKLSPERVNFEHLFLTQWMSTVNRKIESAQFADRFVRKFFKIIEYFSRNICKAAFLRNSWISLLRRIPQKLDSVYDEFYPYKINITTKLFYDITNTKSEGLLNRNHK